LDGIGGYTVLHLVDGTVIAGQLPARQSGQHGMVHIGMLVAGRSGVFVNPSAILYAETVTEAQARAVARRHSRRPWWWPGPDGQPRRRWSLSKSGVGLLITCVVIAALGLGAMLGQRALDSWRLRPLVEAVRATEAAPAARGPVEAQEAVVASRAVVAELPRPTLRVPTLAFRGDSGARDVVAAVALDMRTPVAIPDEVYDQYFDRPGIGAALNGAQAKYGTSALGMAGIIGHETGRCQFIIAPHNLAGINAGGPNPAAAAWSFESDEACVDELGRLLGGAYLSPDGQFHNGFRVQDVNACYASDQEHWTPGVLRHMQAIVELAQRMGPAELRIAAAD